MERGLLAQLALGADAVAVPYKQHPDHQFGIDGGAADVAVKGLKLFVKIGQNRCHEHVDAAKKVAPRDHLIKIELVEQSALIAILPAHHDQALLLSLNSRNQGSRQPSRTFSTASAISRHAGRPEKMPRHF